MPFEDINKRKTSIPTTKPEPFGDSLPEDEGRTRQFVGIPKTPPQPVNESVSTTNTSDIKVGERTSRRYSSWDSAEQYSFLCPTCGSRLVATDCMIDISDLIIEYLKRHELRAFKDLMDNLRSVLKKYGCPVSISELMKAAEKEEYSLTAIQMIEYILFSFGYSVEKNGSLKAEDALSRDVNATSEEKEILTALLNKVSKARDEIMLAGELIICYKAVEGKKDMPYQVMVKLSAGDDVYARRRCCPNPHCRKQLGSMNGTAEEISVAMNGKPLGGKSTFLCAIASVLNNQERMKRFSELFGGVGARALECEFDLDGGDGGLQKDFQRNIQEYERTGHAVKTQANERLHFTAKVTGWEYRGSAGNIKKVHVSKIVTFFDLPGELTLGQTVFAAVNQANISLLCFTPGQFGKQYRITEIEQNRESQSLSANTAPQQYDEDEFSMSKILNRYDMLARPGQRRAILIPKSDIFNDAILCPSDNDDNIAASNLACSNQYYGIFQKRFQSYCNHIRDHIGQLSSDGKQMVTHYYPDGAFHFDENGIFAVSCGSSGSEGSGARLIGVYEVMLWIFAQAGLIPMIEFQEVEQKKGLLSWCRRKSEPKYQPIPMNLIAASRLKDSGQKEKTGGRK